MTSAGRSPPPGSSACGTCSRSPTASSMRGPISTSQPRDVGAEPRRDPRRPGGVPLMYDLAAIAIGIACFACVFAMLYVLDRI